MAWQSLGLQVNPLDATILADTGPLAGAGSSQFGVILSSTVVVVAVVEHRDAANAATIESHMITTGLNGVVTVAFPMTFNDQERLRVRLSGALVGQCQATIT